MPLDHHNAIFSQPADTGTGTHLTTRITYALDKLREDDRTYPDHEIVRYLSIPDHDEDGKRLLKKALMVNAKVEHQEGRHETGDKGTIYFRFRPMHGVRSAEDLLVFLQQQTTAQGILVRELRDGWAGCLQSINELESEGKVLVLRNKKEGTPRMVWLNDPSLNHEVDGDFKDLWHQVQVPKGAADLRNSLLEFGLTPTSNVTAPAPARKQEKKKKPARRGGKTTNTHLSGVLKDYSFMRAA